MPAASRNLLFRAALTDQDYCPLASAESAGCFRSALQNKLVPIRAAPTESDHAITQFGRKERPTLHQT